MKEVIHEMFSEEQVQNKIVEIAEKLNKEYAGQSLHLICILKGSIFFFTEKIIFFYSLLFPDLSVIRSLIK